MTSPPPHYATPEHCERCGREVTLTQAEADMLAVLAREFPGLKEKRRTVLCEVCERAGVQ